MHEPQKQTGFTLIELLVVLFIISIVSGTVLMTISRSTTKEVQAVTNELAQSITLAQEQAMLQPAVLGLNLTSNSFQFYVYEDKANKKGIWLPMDEEAFKSHSIPPNVQVTLASGNQAASDDEDNGDDDSDKPIQPEILISTSGDVTPFTIYVGKKGATPLYVIRGDSNGSISVKANGEQ